MIEARHPGASSAHPCGAPTLKARSRTPFYPAVSEPRCDQVCSLPAWVRRAPCDFNCARWNSVTAGPTPTTTRASKKAADSCPISSEPPIAAPPRVSTRDLESSSYSFSSVGPGKERGRLAWPQTASGTSKSCEPFTRYITGSGPVRSVSADRGGSTRQWVGAGRSRRLGTNVRRNLVEQSPGAAYCYWIADPRDSGSVACLTTTTTDIMEEDLIPWKLSGGA